MVTVAEYQALLAQEKKGRSKYGNTFVKCETWGLFHSKGEYSRWCDLILLQKSGEITDLRRQVTYEFPLLTDEGKPHTYIADFVYRKTGECADITEDFKGFFTEDYLIKKSAMRYFFGIEIYETRAKEPRVKDHKQFYGRKKK